MRGSGEEKAELRSGIVGEFAYGIQCRLLRQLWSIFLHRREFHRSV
jgi:hypothetical protein